MSGPILFFIIGFFVKPWPIGAGLSLGCGLLMTALDSPNYAQWWQRSKLHWLWVMTMKTGIGFIMSFACLALGHWFRSLF